MTVMCSASACARAARAGSQGDGTGASGRSTHQALSVGAQQLDRAAGAEVERAVEAAHVVDVDGRAGDAAEARAGEAAAEHERRVAGDAADERLAHEQPEVGVLALRDEVGAVAEIGGGERSRGGAQVQAALRVEQEQVAYLWHAANVPAQ